MKRFMNVAIAMVILTSLASARVNRTKLNDDVRAQQVKDMKWGMFICWSFSTFSGVEWTREPHGPELFKATGCDTDQWCRTAKKAGMGYILFLAKHHDGFCLWDTKTTDLKVTNSPLGKDVIAKLHKSCDKYGIKLALYFSEGDWPMDRKKATTAEKAELKKAQLKELLTKYGPIEFWWFDHAAGTGGLSHKDTTDWMHKFQPNTFVGYNHGEASGRMCLRERGKPGKLGDAKATKYNKGAEASFKGYKAAEFTYPLLPPHRGGAQWFYSLPKHDNLCHKADKIYRDYLGAVKYENVFSINIGPNYEGKIRDIDVKTLTQVGTWIRSGKVLAKEKAKVSGLKLKGAKASSTWDSNYSADKAIDNNEATRWGAAKGHLTGWLEIDFGSKKSVKKIVISEGGFYRIKKFEIECYLGGKWVSIYSGTSLGSLDTSIKPVTGQRFRLSIKKSIETPTIAEFMLFDK